MLVHEKLLKFKGEDSLLEKVGQQARIQDYENNVKILHTCTHT